MSEIYLCTSNIHYWGMHGILSGVRATGNVILIRPLFPSHLFYVATISLFSLWLVFQITFMMINVHFLHLSKNTIIMVTLMETAHFPPNAPLGDSTPWLTTYYINKIRCQAISIEGGGRGRLNLGKKLNFTTPLHPLIFLQVSIWSDGSLFRCLQGLQILL